MYDSCELVNKENLINGMKLNSDIGQVNLRIHKENCMYITNSNASQYKH